MKFSERHGFSPIRELQIESIDKDLKNSLWNQIITFVLNYSQRPSIDRRGNTIYFFIKKGIWGDHFKNPLDDFSMVYYRKDLRKIYNRLTWFQTYDLLEYIARNHPNSDLKSKFIKACNEVLIRENSAYRFVEGIISNITSKEEITEIEEAMKEEDPFKPVSIHLKDALKLLTDRKSPDFRNSIKESISAVESICSFISGGKKSTLGQALKEVEKRFPLHDALKSAF